MGEAIQGRFNPSAERTQNEIHLFHRRISRCLDRPRSRCPPPLTSYPSRTVSIVVPYPPGGSVDGVARIIAQKLSEIPGQNFIVENRAGGAGGIVGANYVAKAAPDGYTLLLTASIHVVTPFLHKSVPYDVVTDFTPVTLIASGPLIVSTAPQVPANTLKEFFDLVRKNPNKYTFATSSFGSAGHMAVELLKRDAGVSTLVIAYKGAGPALTDLDGRSNTADGGSDVVLVAACESRKDQGSRDHQHKASPDRS